jgi:hypothetical protein
VRGAAEEVREVEDAADVDVEAVIRLTRPDLALVAVEAERIDEFLHEPFVVLRRVVDDLVGVRSDVDRRDWQPGAEHFALHGAALAVRELGEPVRLLLSGELREELLAAAEGRREVGRVHALDVRRRELDLVRDHVVEALVAAREVHLVEDVVGEAVVVGATGRLLEGVVRGDDVQDVVLAVFDPGPDVRVVGGRVEPDGRCFTVARRAGERDDAGETESRERAREIMTCLHDGTVLPDESFLEEGARAAPGIAEAPVFQGFST